MTPVLISTITTLFILTATSATSVGITYDPTIPNLPSPKLVAAALSSHHVSSVRLLNPTPTSVRAFSGTNISLFLSLPNSLISSFAYSRSTVYLWLAHHVFPFHLSTRISLISLGSVRPWPTVHIFALRNFHWCLIDAGINTISVSTTFPFDSIASFPLSSAKFKDYESVSPILDFLEETNSPFLVNLYPYDIYRSSHYITSIGFALFDEHRYLFRDEDGVRYWSLYEMMLAAVNHALSISGHGDSTVIVAETGWPSSNEENINSAEIYLRGLITYLRRSEHGKQGEAAEVYIYQLFDNSCNDDEDNYSLQCGALGYPRDWKSWGIMHPNMTMKYSSLVFGVEDDHVGPGKLTNAVIALFIVIYAGILAWLLLLGLGSMLCGRCVPPIRLRGEAKCVNLKIGRSKICFPGCTIIWLLNDRLCCLSESKYCAVRCI